MGPGFESLKVHQQEVPAAKHRGKMRFIGKVRKRGLVCAFNAKGPPVPIPNTEVKLCSAENTWLETAREDRS